MAIFLSQYTNRVDKKGRVSVPSAFRAVLGEQLQHGIVVFKCLQHPALEACSAAYMEQLSDSLERQDLPADELEQIEMTIFGGSQILPVDGEGRVVLPQAFCEFAGITEEAAFVGRRRTFQIWNPERLRECEDTARGRARSKDISLNKIIANAQMAKSSTGGAA